jgi:ACT domain-containing protein
MAVTVKKAVLWRKEIDNRPGMLANILEPLSEAGTDLQVVMAYRYPGGKDTTAIELHLVSGRKPIAAAKAAGLVQSPIPTLLVEGGQSAGARPCYRKSDR